MHIVLDARKVNDGGIGTYIRNLIVGLSRSPGVKLSLIAQPDEVGDLPTSVEIIEEYSRPYSLGEYFAMPLRLREQIAAADVFHSPHFTLPYFLTAPSVVTIHDTILLTYPRRRRDAAIARCLIRSAMKRAERIITVSDTSKDKLSALLPSAAEKIRVVHNFHLQPDGAEALSVPTLEQEGQGDFLFIGSERTHKGFDRLIEAWKILYSRLGARCPKLVAVGREFHSSRESIRGSEVERYIVFLEDVANVELRRLIRQSCFLFMPSRDEGFGFPVLEALAEGTPAICSDIPVFRELFPAGTIFVKEQTGSGFAAAVETVQNNPGLRTKLGELGRRCAARFSEQEHITETLKVYSECVR